MSKLQPCLAGQWSSLKKDVYDGTESFLLCFPPPISYAHLQTKPKGFHGGNVVLDVTLLETFRKLFHEGQGTREFLGPGHTRTREL